MAARKVVARGGGEGKIRWLRCTKVKFGWGIASLVLVTRGDSGGAAGDHRSGDPTARVRWLKRELRVFFRETY